MKKGQKIEFWSQKYLIFSKNFLSGIEVPKKRFLFEWLSMGGGVLNFFF